MSTTSKFGAGSLEKIFTIDENTKCAIRSLMQVSRINKWFIVVCISFTMFNKILIRNLRYQFSFQSQCI